MRGDGGPFGGHRLGAGRAVCLLAVASLLLCAAAAFAQEAGDEAVPDTLAPPTLAPPLNVTAVDTPNDRGESINVSWELSPDDDVDGDPVGGYRVYRSTHPDTGFTYAGRVGYGITLHRDSGVENVESDGGPSYYYRVAAVDEHGNEFLSAVSEPATATPQWFDMTRLNVMIAVIIFVTAIIYFVQSAKSGRELFIRRLAGLDEMDNAVGRATEMGKPILYITGLSGISDVATIAAINILGEVAKKTAEYNTRLIVPCADPIVMAVEQEVVKEAYAEVGRPDAYNEDDVFYLTRSQFAYVAGVNGIMVRQRPATILYMGMFYAESLVLAETGASVGSIQIAGTDAVTQLPFFITSCDYTLIGEELYAASAYLSREPVLLGGLKGQDTVKFLIGIFLIAGVVAATLAATGVIEADMITPLLETG
jgi:hypothetical protein